MANLNQLNNLSTLEINNTLINNTQEIGSNLITNANNQTGGYLGLGIMIIIFIFFMIILMNQQEVFKMNFIESLIVSSGFVMILGIIGLVTGFFTSYRHVMWFALIFIVGLVSKYQQNKGG